MSIALKEQEDVAKAAPKKKRVLPSYEDEVTPEQRTEIKKKYAELGMDKWKKVGKSGW